MLNLFMYLIVGGIMLVLLSVLLGALLLPVYLWVLWRDSEQAPQRAAELAEINALLAETDALLAETRAAERPAPSH